MSNEDKNIINLLSGCVGYPLFDHLYGCTCYDKEALEQVYHTLFHLFQMGNDSAALSILQLICSITGFAFPFSEGADLADAKQLNYFLNEFLLDFGEYIEELKHVQGHD
ncbi:hypothetical protein LJC34_02575 [Oscillospiraceae bacterium OttesenSCG-928-G22]|nr:hypothetical protein [Oscillospiraceae bacterium OttesenSCG-928-G22]